MKRICAVALLAVVAWAGPALAATVGQPKTVFDAIAEAWAVGTVALGKPMPFREGRVIVFPAQIKELLYAKTGSPRNLMVVYEVASSEMTKPFFNENDTFVAPIQLLPENSFWRDNLPLTPRHAVLGGRRNVFRGEEIPEAKRVFGLFIAAHARQSHERWGAELDAVAQTLNSSVARLCEDAVQFLTDSPRLATNFPDSAKDPIATFLEGPAPQALKVTLVDALGAAKVGAMSAELRKLGEGKGPLAVSSMLALDQMGSGVSLDHLLELSRSPSDDIRAYAAGRLGRDFSGEAPGFDRAVVLLGADQPELIRNAAATGLGHAGNAKAIAPLQAALAEGGNASKSSALALAAIGGEEAGKVLKDALVSGTPAAGAAAVAALPRIVGCLECGKVLQEQATQNPDKGVRDLIGVMLELPKPHHH